MGRVSLAEEASSRGRWCPEEEAGWLSWAIFGFVGSLVEKGYGKPLRQEDLWALPRAEEASLQCRLFDAALTASIDPVTAPQVLIPSLQAAVHMMS